MRSEQLSGELGSLIRRMEQRILQHPMYADLLSSGADDAELYHVLSSLEDAIVGLVLLHIRMRQEFEK